MYVEMKNIYKKYGDFVASDHVSFGVEKGKLVALLGPSGSGKTTLLKAVCGELPHGGHVVLEGLELAGLRAKELAKRVSYIPQQSGISISMSVLDVVLMGFYSKLCAVSLYDGV